MKKSNDQHAHYTEVLIPHPFCATGTDLVTDNLLRLPAEFGCPTWVYNTQIVRRQIAQLNQFDVARFAQKAYFNIRILCLMREQGVKVDSVSLGETERALAVGYDPQQNPEDIVSITDLINDVTLDRVKALRVPVNAGSIDILSQLDEVPPGHRVWLRVNPGFGRGHSQKTNTDGENSKHGIWYNHLPAVPEVMCCYQLQLVGIHIHIGSGVDYGHLEQVCDAMVRQVVDLGRDLQVISAGGGLSIPYREGEEAIDTTHYYGLWNRARKQIAAHLEHPVKLEVEPGRLLVAESDVLMSQVHSVKEMGSRHFMLIDAGFNGLIRPTVYDSYHHITALAADGYDPSAAPQVKIVVTGPLCESGDVFTQQEGGKIGTRLPPTVAPGDYLVLHDTDAYGAPMSFSYNSRPLLLGVLLDGGRTRLVRRRQTIQELLALELT